MVQTGKQHHIKLQNFVEQEASMLECLQQIICSSTRMEILFLSLKRTALNSELIDLSEKNGLIIPCKDESISTEAHIPSTDEEIAKEAITEVIEEDGSGSDAIYSTTELETVPCSSGHEETVSEQEDYDKDNDAAYPSQTQNSSTENTSLSIPLNTTA